MPLEIGPGLVIDDAELDERFVRASGPGGQNVNKVSTAVQLRFDVGRSMLPGDVRERLRGLAGSRMTDSVMMSGDALRVQPWRADDADSTSGAAGHCADSGHGAGSDAS